MKIITPIICAILLITSQAIAAENNSQPEISPTYLSDDILWRPREILIFNMLDEVGSGFNLKFTVRDMNTYVQAPAPVYFFVEAPDGSVIAQEFMEDDGITGGNFKNQDGIYDPFADFRYRQYHRVNSPGGYPADKERSPFLTNPQKLPARSLSLKVPAAGKGLYRVFVCGRWDHWISVSSDRVMPTGIHPGAGPLYVFGTSLNKSYFYIPEISNDIGLALTEEIQPYNWSIQLKNPAGNIISTAKASGFCTFITLPKQQPGVYELDISGNTTGACLHAKGFPLVICPDKVTAEKIKGGLQNSKQQDYAFHSFSKTLYDWADSLKKSDLEVNVQLRDAQKKTKIIKHFAGANINITLGDVLKKLNEQNIDPTAKDFGVIKNPATQNTLAAIASYNSPENPYYGNKALIRRVVLSCIEKTAKLDPAFHFENGEVNYQKTDKPTHYFQLPTRSNWYGLGGDANHIIPLMIMKNISGLAVADKVINAYKQAFTLWAYGRFNMHVGEVANQWGWNFRNLMYIYNLTGDEEIAKQIRRHAKLITTTGLYGRLNPEYTPFDKRHNRLDVDCGMTNSGYMPEQLGFDGEYSCEQTLLWGSIWKEFKLPEIVKWFNHFNTLKTYLTLSKTEKAPTTTFTQSCSPTDLNFRTRYMTHKNHQPKEMIGMVDYLDLWFPKKNIAPKKNWPFLETENFIKIIGDKFYFINNQNYYAILYGGPRAPLWSLYSAGEASGNSINFDGFDGPGYGGWGYKANKPGEISALYIKDCGPVLLGQNHTVMDSNTVWGKSEKPLFAAAREDVDSREFAACYGQSDVEFNKEKMAYQITENVPFVPLEVRTNIIFKEDKISVALEIVALKDFQCSELNYSIPFFADKRQVSYTNSTGEIKLELPATILTPARPKRPDKKLEDSRWESAEFTANTISITNQTGNGIKLLFADEQKIKPLRPFRYRDVGPAGGALIIRLPKKLSANQNYKLNYEIKVLRK